MHCTYVKLSRMHQKPALSKGGIYIAITQDLQQNTIIFLCEEAQYASSKIIIICYQSFKGDWIKTQEHVKEMANAYTYLLNERVFREL